MPRARSATERHCAAAPMRADFSLATTRTTYFEPLGDLIKTGPTGTNVMDVRIVLAG